MQTHEKDIYDLEVERLTKEPSEIYYEWASGFNPLFRFIGDDHEYECGCLTMIRRQPEIFYAETNGKRNDELKAAILEDDNIPKLGGCIFPAHLPDFAKWQRRIDRMNAGESFEEVMKSTR